MFLVIFFVSLIGALIAPIFSISKLFLFLPFLFWKNKRLFFTVFLFLVINFYGGINISGDFEFVGKVIQTSDSYSLVFGKVYYNGKWIFPRMLVGVNEEIPLGDIVYYYGEINYEKFSYPKVKLEKNRVIVSPYFSVFRTIYLTSENFRKKLLNYNEIYYGLFGGKVKDKYLKESGLYHFFSISGLHISIIYVFLVLLFSSFSFQKYIALIFSFLFVVATGLNLPTIRAFLLLFFSNVLENKKYSKVDILCLIGIVFLFLEPSLAFSLSFYMSFFSTLGILLVENKFLKSVSAFLGSAPFLALFSSVNIFSILGTFLLVIPFQILLVVVFVSFFLDLLCLTTFSEFLLTLFNPLTIFVENVAIFFSKMPKIPGGIFAYFFLELFFFVFLLHFGHIPYILKSKSSN
ncbi:competence protein ComEC [Thermosipho melanesiensis]|uniref:ComEC/Rec2-related protein n=2 Tax=Thermosipho melanesiensis TaxID=46541 RepID=A6LMV6_THEM4|nr:ComEC/Rec2 family competence protein [Thermosipho melanesiensis]ABR31257.1 ComEC/Rec2-related protein [Thermosipho melanesiensis BI429]APT74901.1 competence protein ComEC [Thermosipho melanesiensis]OOC36280.1 competence protein ComEC [Thermosipho melanesiensis]OOC37098.1 competence protein ComEC [Thermosipho melanesiensis]OOC37850.1 competence protein ComEC [Thermosipho melanesiensis]